MTATASSRRQLTSGEFVGQGIEKVDEKARVLYFAACGREPGEDPYFTHLYRVNLDGTGLKLLDQGDASHIADMNDAGRYFVDNFSRVDAAPKSELRDAAGNLLLELEATDVTALLAAGFKYPEPFKVKADDGITDLYGVMYKPFDFDPNAKYPIIAYVYPGPQTESVSKTFVPRNANVALAQLGFVVIEVGNRGGHPSRSKWYHNYGYGNLRDYGLADKKRAIEQLATLHPYIDIDRVGIYGHSGGGFMSTAAMLVYPDFFKVAVSSSGNHENNVYNRWWSEKHHGVKEVTDKDGNVEVRVLDRQELRDRREPQGPPAHHDRRHRQQRPPGQHLAPGRGPDQGQQALRFLHLPRPAPRLRRHERLLVLVPGGLLLQVAPGRFLPDGRPHRAPAREGAEGRQIARGSGHVLRGPGGPLFRLIWDRT